MILPRIIIFTLVKIVMVRVMMLIVAGVAMIEEKSRLTLDEGNSEHEFISRSITNLIT